MFVKIVPHRCIEGICVAFLLTGVNVDFKISGSALLEASDDATAIEAILGVPFEDFKDFVNGPPGLVFPRRRRKDGERESAQGFFQGHGRHLRRVINF